jgi:hypothetical protein
VYSWCSSDFGLFDDLLRKTSLGMMGTDIVFQAL